MAVPTEIAIFDRAQIARNRQRAAARFSSHDFLFRRVVSDISERLLDVRRNFPAVLQIGARGGSAEILKAAKCSRLTTMDIAPALLGQNDNGICADEENLPFAPQTFDLAVSALGLHAVNDLPGALVQIRRVLVPDGLFIGALFGGETLKELRASLMQAELNIRGGIGPRVAPMADRLALAGLMQRAGFALPVVDMDTVTVMYRDIFHLMSDLRGMGEANAVSAKQKTMTGRKMFLEAGRIYQEQFADTDGKIPATFEIIYLNGWSPHESQQKPLARGSAKLSLTEALEC